MGWRGFVPCGHDRAVGLQAEGGHGSRMDASKRLRS